MYALYITLCVTAGGNAFPQPQRRLHIWYYDLVLEDFVSLIDVFGDVFRRGTASHHRGTSPGNHCKLVCLTFWIVFSDKQSYGL